MIKIKSCYIENYGKISSKEFVFDNNLTEFFGENGFGKSTLASFIKAMFYGLSSVRINGKDFNDRMHFYPFSGGLFGGNLTFEKDGKVYKIERFFDKKSDKDDEFKAFCNGSLCENLEELKGEKLFGVDEESFIRTLFITSSEIEISSTSAINSKLNNIVDNTDETNNFTSAYNIIESKQKQYKLRGDKGLIKNKSEEILNLRAKISELEFKNNSLDAKYDELNKLKKEIEELEKEVTKANADFVVLENWKTYDGFLKDIKTKKEKLLQIEKEFSNKIPSSQDIISLQSLTDEVYLLNEKLNSLSKVGTQEQKFYELNAIFSKGVPAKEKLQETANNITKLRKTEDSKSKPAKISGFTNILLPIFALLFVVGIIALFLSPIVGGISMGIGVIGCVILFILQAKNKEKTINNNINEQTLLKSCLDEFFNGYGYNNSNYEGNLIEIQGKIDFYNLLKKEIEDKKEANKEVEEEFKEKTFKVNEAIKSLGFSLQGNLKNTVNYISQKLREYDLAKGQYYDAFNVAEEFKIVKGLTNRLDIDENLLSSLTAQTKLKQTEYYKLLKFIEDEERLLEELPILENKLNNCLEELEKLKKEYDLYTKTLQFLQMAENALEQKYIAPIKDRFLYYSNKLEKALSEKMSMDQNYQVSFEKNGKVYSHKHLSLGQLAISNLCIRLALIDNMYKENSPFIILDDPFTSLDKEHMEKMQLLMKELSKDRQIIYFTCHSSRKII